MLLAQTRCRLSVQDGSLGLRLMTELEVRAHSIVLTMGVSYRRLNAPGVERLTGRGVYYGAAAVDAGVDERRGHLHRRGRELGWSGGDLISASRAKSVTMLVRGESLSASMSQYLIDRIEKTPNIRVLLIRR